jgi:hypothetical protein
MVQVSLRLSNGSTERNAFSVHYDDLVLAEPGKREMAMVVSGKHKGRQGTVKVGFIFFLAVFQIADCSCVLSLPSEHHRPRRDPGSGLGTAGDVQDGLCRLDESPIVDTSHY